MVAYVKRDALVAFLDRTLGNNAGDSALNGLQVEGRERVGKVGLAVDACLAVFEKAAAAGVHFLVVHHGLLWGQEQPLTGIYKKRISALVRSGISLYASHFPLDSHPKAGNNAQLAKMAGARKLSPFGEMKGSFWGLQGAVKEQPLASFVSRLERALSAKALVFGFGKSVVRKAGFVSGSGTFAVEEAASRGLDVLVTGEMRHSAYHVAREAAVNLVCLGHYKTETLGVKALGSLISRRFGVKTVFIEEETGL